MTSRCVSKCVPLSGSKVAIALQQRGLTHLLEHHPVSVILSEAEKQQIVDATPVKQHQLGVRKAPCSTAVELRSTLFGSDNVPDAEDREVFRNLVQTWPTLASRRKKRSRADNAKH